MTRHYGMDWLRIGAFALLIFYHVGMVFVPWNFHVKLQIEDWVAVPMLATNPWRLALLFVVSGYASRALLARSRHVGAFAGNRSKRLLVPLLVGVFVVVPPQPWAEVASKYGYTHGLPYFFAHDYFRFGTFHGIVLPTWQHLWFVVYLWVYTLLLAGLLAFSSARIRGGAQRAFDRVFATPALFVVPGLWAVAVTTLLFPGARETHALFGDWVAHASYFPMFLFGFGLAKSPATLALFARWWLAALVVALASYAVVAWMELRWPGNVRVPFPWNRVFSAARGVQAWSAIAALIGIAERFWNRDHPWRATLTEAVFPFYIIHQTVIVLVAFWLIPAGLPMAANFGILVAATIVGCWAFYLGGRSIGWLRPLIGLRPLSATARMPGPRPVVV